MRTYWKMVDQYYEMGFVLLGLLVINFTGLQTLAGLVHLAVTLHGNMETECHNVPSKTGCDDLCQLKTDEDNRSDGDAHPRTYCK